MRLASAGILGLQVGEDVTLGGISWLRAYPVIFAGIYACY